MAGIYASRGTLSTGIKCGAVAGAIATWSISFVIAMTELVLGFKIGTFYSVMGISLGLDNVATAAYIAFGLHILTGTVLGAIVGGVALRARGVLGIIGSVELGIISGVIISLALFIPVTLFLIEPSIQRITLYVGISSDQPILSSGITAFVSVVTAGAVAFHILWGGIFGYIISSLLRIRAYRISHVGVKV